MGLRPHRRLSTIALALIGMCVAPRPGYADWTKTIDCSGPRVYRDVRRDAGREEFCELHLPGSLAVNDGPYRSWFSEDSPADEGDYKNGRKVGVWKECDRFDRCRQITYDAILPNEVSPDIKPEIPVSFEGGKYVFDFRSCWSTWVTQLKDDEPMLELNIGRGIVRCEVTHIPHHSSVPPFSTDDHYLCRVPYTVGLQRFDSLDLREEFSKAGLPQFCGHDTPSPSQRSKPSEDPDHALKISVNAAFIAFSTKQQVRAWTFAAQTVDVECASIQKQESGPDMLTVRLNRYVEELVVQRIGKDDVRAEACSQPIALGPLETIREESGRTLFRFSMNENAANARRQRACIAAQIELQPTCSAGKF